nr:sigma factor-like helix-turn-helix DNA-binding protein [Glycomyces terrestris]
MSRICLDVLGSARRRRERYVGEWLPEPAPGALAAASGPEDRGDPAELAAREETVGYALLLVLETMTPAERVVFVLHDVFGYRFAEIGAIVGRSAGACRQLASAARRRVREGRRREVDPAVHARVVAAFKDAWQHGDPDRLLPLLDPGAAAVVDGGGLVSAPTAPVVGAAGVAALLAGVHEKAPALTVEVADVNGRTGLLARDGSGDVMAVIAVATAGDRVRRLWVVRNPAKLTAWRSPAK